MFGLFRKDIGPGIIDKIWLTTPAKWKACEQMLHINAECRFVAWFDQTKNELENSVQTSALLGHQLTLSEMRAGMVVFVEHHPSYRRENAVFSQFGLAEIPVLSALDEPLFMHFGGERLLELVRKMGMREDEAVGNSLVVKSIRNAQRKIDAKVEFEKAASSQGEWLALNLPNGL